MLLVCLMAPTWAAASRRPGLHGVRHQLPGVAVGKVATYTVNNVYSDDYGPIMTRA